MKHNLRVTLVLLSIYIVAQGVGLGLLALDAEIEKVDGRTTLGYDDTALGPRPALEGFSTLLYLAAGVTLGTVLLLLIIRFKKVSLWKFWFALAAFMAMALALDVVAKPAVAFGTGAVLAYLKVFRPNIWVHNITEVLMYSGIAIFLVPMLDLFWAVVMLLAFSLYDMYAVWRSKHMVKMAEFQSDAQLFAGLNIPYDEKKKKITVQAAAQNKKRKLPGKEIRSAVLGGGDIAFPLLFTGTVLQWLLLQGESKLAAVSYSLVVTVFSAVALAGLFFLAEKDKFYPAMPFITVGCLAGLGIVYLI